jgi:hypothetical protein
VKGTSRRVVDTDADGIPDGIEFLAGTNPLEPENSADSDFDGADDWLEVQQHTNVLANDPKIRSRYSYQYDVVDEGLVPLDQGSGQPSYVRQYRFVISNVDIADTLAGPAGGAAAGSNRLRFFIAQVPEDNPDAPPLFRVAEAVVNANAGGQTIALTPGDFELLP